MKRFFLVPVLGVAVLGLGRSATAQSSWPDLNRAQYAERQSYYDSRRAAYDTGFREGAKQGEKDGRQGSVFAYQDERAFQRADKGYNRQYGDIDRYRQSFRSGYVAGYSDSYQRYARNASGRYGSNGRYDDGRVYPQQGRYPDVRPGNPGQYGGYSNQGFDNGVRDGVEKGAEDARKNRSFDVLRHKWYREGDRNYEGRYGSREQYKDVYRAGFTQGYERGYRDARYR